jgi:hypothetical protein
MAAGSAAAEVVDRADPACSEFSRQSEFRSMESEFALFVLL